MSISTLSAAVSELVQPNLLNYIASFPSIRVNVGPLRLVMVPLVTHIQLDLNLLEYIIQGQVIATSWQICARISFEVFSALCSGSVVSVHVPPAFLDGLLRSLPILVSHDLARWRAS